MHLQTPPAVCLTCHPKGLMVFVWPQMGHPFCFNADARWRPVISGVLTNLGGGGGLPGAHPVKFHSSQRVGGGGLGLGCVCHLPLPPSGAFGPS